MSNKKWIYVYKVEYWDPDNSEICSDKGIVISKSFAKAATRIEKYYGEDLVSITQLEPTQEGALFDWSMMEEAGLLKEE